MKNDGWQSAEFPVTPLMIEKSAEITKRRREGLEQSRRWYRKHRKAQG